MSSPPPATPAPELIWLRLLRGVVAVTLALVLTIITALFVLSRLPAVRDVFAPLFTDESKLPRVPLVLAILFVIFLPSLLLFWPLIRRFFQSPDARAQLRRDGRGRFRWLGWTGLAVGWVLVTPVLIWLAHDDPAIRQPVSIEEFSPAFPGAEQSYAVLMQYSKQTPSPEAQALAAVKLAVPAFGVHPQDAAKWVEFVTANRAGLEADWATLAPQRRWLGELAAFDRIGDLTPRELEANILTFQPWRHLAYHTCALATLQALDGHADDAMATLLPLLEVSRKLQPSSRTLLRSMTAEMAERMTLLTAAIVLDHGSIAPATRARLNAALASDNAAALARRVIMVDYVLFAPLYLSAKLGDAVAPAQGAMAFSRRPLNFLSGLFLNPNATMNLYGDHVRELAELAEARELGRFAVRSKDFGDNELLHLGMKNLGGRLMLNMAVPAYEKVLETHWKIADLRDALRKRLAMPM
jgi:hypothetical protein